MTFKVKISSQNQITLPVDLLKQLGLTGGNYLYIQPDAEDFRILNTGAKISKLAGSLGKKIKDKSKLLKTPEEFKKALQQSKNDHFKNWIV